MKFPFEAEFYKLNAEQAKRFLSLPETGMGYQLIYETNSNIIDFLESPIVTNAEFIIQYENNYNVPIITNFTNLNLNFESLDNFQNTLNNIGVVTNENFIRTGNIGGALPPYLYVTRHGDEFRRLSAFRNDRRILTDGSVLPETYATTLSDLTVVPSGLAAVARYALPNRLPATYIYQIIPEPGTHVYFGTITPNFGLCGGGVEVYFPNGCGPGSAKLIGTISEM